MGPSKSNSASKDIEIYCVEIDVRYFCGILHYFHCYRRRFANTNDEFRPFFCRGCVSIHGQACTSLENSYLFMEHSDRIAWQMRYLMERPIRSGRTGDTRNMFLTMWLDGTSIRFGTLGNVWDFFTHFLYYRSTTED